MSFTGLSIIIPTKDRGAVFDKTLSAAYSSCEGIPSEILVINDSKTNSPVIPQNFLNRVKLFHNPKQGVASARNFGAKQAVFSHFVFLDDDIIIFPNNLHDLLHTIDQNPGAAINLNWIYPPQLTSNIEKTQFGRYLIQHGFTSLKGWNGNLVWKDDALFEISLLASYFLCINSQNFKDAGGYNEQFPHAGAEDFEFAMRLKKSGIRGLCDSRSTVWHNEEDRVDIKAWMFRKQRAAETRKIAVHLGYPEMAIQAGTAKVNVLRSVYFMQVVLFFLLKIIPNLKVVDGMYFKLVNIVLTLNLYKGYFKNKS